MYKHIYTTGCGENAKASRARAEQFDEEVVWLEGAPFIAVAGGGRFFVQSTSSRMGDILGAWRPPYFKLAKTKDWGITVVFMLHLWDLTIYYVAFCVAHHLAELSLCRKMLLLKKLLCRNARQARKTIGK